MANFTIYIRNMRYLLAFILILFTYGVNAQNRFPSVDSAKNYVLRYIKNSAVESFTNYRMQNTVYGNLELLDSLASDPAIDSIWKNGDTLRYSKASTIYTVGVFTTQTPTLQQVTTAGNSTNDSIVFSNVLGSYLKLGYTTGGPTNGRAAFINLGTNFSSFPYIRINASNIEHKTWTGDRVNTFPDTSGNLAVGVKVNGITTLSSQNGIIDIGNTDTATVVKAYVTNAEAVTITKGQVVYIFGASGD
ncbi:MAG: hypothetical protein ACK518_03680, partial [bacterium]